MYSLHSANKLLFSDEDIKSLEPLLGELKNKTLFITGATGYVGKCFLDLLLTAEESLGLNMKIHILTRNTNRFLTEFPRIRTFKNISFIEQDIRESLESVPYNLDFIIHGATPASSQERAYFLKQNPISLLDMIKNSTEKILSLCKSRKDTKCLYISSGAVYDSLQSSIKFQETDYQALNNDSELLLTKKSDPYSLGKILSERAFLKAQAQSEFTNFNITRCFSFIGPYLPINSGFLGSSFFENITRKEAITIKGSGNEIRGFMHSRDLAIWLITILIKGKPSETYNVGSDAALSVKEFASKISEYFNNHEIYVKKQITPNTPRKYYVADISKARQELGLELKYSKIENSIKDAADWYGLR